MQATSACILTTNFRPRYGTSDSPTDKRFQSRRAGQNISEKSVGTFHPLASFAPFDFGYASASLQCYLMTSFLSEKIFYHGWTRIHTDGKEGSTMLDTNRANYCQLNSLIREIRISPLSVFIRVHPWLKKKLCGSLRPRRLCVEGVSVWLWLRRAASLRYSSQADGGIAFRAAAGLIVSGCNNPSAKPGTRLTHGSHLGGLHCCSRC
ncbi:MAG: hypothetical protein ABSC89_15335 [Verrucomicrobiota bacterium]